MVVVIDVVITGTVLGLCVAIFVAAFGLQSITEPFGILSP